MVAGRRGHVRTDRNLGGSHREYRGRKGIVQDFGVRAVPFVMAVIGGLLGPKNVPRSRGRDLMSDGCGGLSMPTYNVTVRLSLLEGFTAEDAELDSAEELGDHEFTVEADSLAKAEERALDVFHGMVPIDNLEAVDVTTRAVHRDQATP
jgi:hypothetical protein